MEPFTGQIMLVGHSFAPGGCAFCAAQLLPSEINIHDLSSGMYTVQLITDRLVVNKILIKK